MKCQNCKKNILFEKVHEKAIALACSLGPRTEECLANNFVHYEPKPSLVASEVIDKLFESIEETLSLFKRITTFRELPELVGKSIRLVAKKDTTILLANELRKGPISRISLIKGQAIRGIVLKHIENAEEIVDILGEQTFLLQIQDKIASCHSKDFALQQVTQNENPD